MSQSDSAMRAAPGELALPQPVQPETGAANLPIAPSHDNRSKLWLTARKAASFPALMGILLGGVSVVGIRLRTPDPDTWWHIAVGQRILDTHRWPTSDPYSFTAAGVPWIAYEWLGEIVMAFAARVGGLLGLAGLQICLAAIATVLLYYYAYVRCGNWKASCVATGLLLPLASVIFALRPQLFGYIFLLITLICLERFRQGHFRALWVLPPLFLVWVNTHGTFVFGLAAIGVYFVCGLVNFQLGGLTAEPWSARQRTHLLFTFLACCLAILVTPYGTELAAYPVIMATTQPFNIANIKEWQPLSFDVGLGKYVLGLLLAIFLAHIFFPRKYKLPELVMLLFAVYAACVHIRFMLVLRDGSSFRSSQKLPCQLDAIGYDPDKDMYAMNLAIIALLAASIVLMVPGKAVLESLVAGRTIQWPPSNTCEGIPSPQRCSMITLMADI